MLKRKDLLILSHLRTNARAALTNISRKTHIPVTTIYDNVRKYEKQFIIKHSSIIDFSKIGFHNRKNIALKVFGPKKELLEYLQEHPNVNSLYRTESEYDLLADVIFRDAKEADAFIETLNSKFKIEKNLIMSITGDLKREDFMSRMILQ